MEKETYYHILEAILYASQFNLLIKGWSRMIFEKGHYIFYWAYLAFSIHWTIALVHRYFVYRSFAIFSIVRTPFDFLIMVFLPLGISLLSIYILMPRSFRGTDLKNLLIKNRVWICLAPMMLVTSHLQHAYLTVGWNLPIIISNFGVLIIYLCFLCTKNLRFFEALVILGILSWVFFLFQNTNYLGLE